MASPTPTSILNASQVQQIQAAISTRLDAGTPADSLSAAEELQQIALSLGQDGEELLAAARKWGKTASNFENQQAKQNTSGLQQVLRTWIVTEPCAFSEVLSASARLDEAITYGQLQDFREAGLAELIQVSSSDGLSWIDASEDLGWGWAPIVEPELCGDFGKGSLMMLAPDTLKKREDSWIWESDPDGLFYSAVKGNMEGYFEGDYFITIDIIPGEVVSAFKVDTESGTGTDAWLSVLAGPWWGSCAGMEQARDLLQLPAAPDMPSGCLLV